MDTFWKNVDHHQFMVHRMFMGGGKSTVVCSLLVLPHVDGDRFTRACMPAALLDFRVLVQGTILFSSAVDARSYVLETVQVWFSVAVQVLRLISHRRRYLLPHRRRSKCSSEVDVDFWIGWTLSCRVSAHLAQRVTGQCVEIFFERVLGFCDRFVVSRHGRVLFVPGFFVSLRSTQQLFLILGSKHSEKKRKKRKRDDGSFGSRLVTSPCHANASPRLRLGAREPG